MTEIFNKAVIKTRRRVLRANMTKAEVLLWLEIKNKKLGTRFLRQYSVEAFVIDFYSPAVKLAIEVDGATHYKDEEIEYDKKRQDIIMKYEIKFLRFTNEEIYDDRFNVLIKIKNEIEILKSNPHRKEYNTQV